jgi:TPR repeat protein
MKRNVVQRALLPLGFALSVFAGMGNAWAEEYRDGVVAMEHGDHKKALRIWSSQADKGNVEAQTMLGALYMKGLGKRVPIDHPKAVSYLEKCEPASLECSLYLGEIYGAVSGTKKDPARAEAFFRKVIDTSPKSSLLINDARKELGALYYRGGLGKDKVEQGKQLLLQAANEGHLDSQFALGVILSRKGQSPEEWMEGIKWCMAVIQYATDAAVPLCKGMIEDAEKKLTRAEVREAQRRFSDWRPSKI